MQGGACGWRMCWWGSLCLAVGGGESAALLFRRELRRMAGLPARAGGAQQRADDAWRRPGGRFGELAEAVNAQLDAAQRERLEGQRRQQEFQRDLASLSHDIRTPLMGAKGYLRLAQDEGDEAGRARRLAAAEARLDDMGALLDQLFAYAHGERPRPRARPCVPWPCCRRLATPRRWGSSPRSRAARMAAAARGLRGRGAFRGRRTPRPSRRIFENLVGERAAPRLGAARGGAARSLRGVRERGARPRRRSDPERLLERFDPGRRRPQRGPGAASAWPCPPASPPPWACACPGAPGRERAGRGACVG